MATPPRIRPPETPPRLIAVDVDGTVLTPQRTVAAQTRRAVVLARERGAQVVLASARSPLGLRPVLLELGLMNSWFVSCQGALVARWTPDGSLDVLTEAPVPVDVADDLEARAVSLGLSVSRFTRTRWLTPKIDEAIEWLAALTGERPETAVGDEGSEEGTLKLLAVAGHPALIPTLNQYAANLTAEVSAAFSHPDHLEITRAEVDKGHGLQALLTRLGIGPEATVAIGDGLNDLGLFAAAGTSIAMGQAPVEVRSAADFTTTSNADDGVARAITAVLAPTTRAS